MKYIRHIQSVANSRFIYEVGRGSETASEALSSFEAELGSLAAEIEMTSTMLNLLQSDSEMQQLSSEAKDEMRDRGVTINDMFTPSVVGGETVYSVNDFLTNTYLSSADRQILYGLDGRLKLADLVKYAGSSQVFN